LPGTRQPAARGVGSRLGGELEVLAPGVGTVSSVGCHKIRAAFVVLAVGDLEHLADIVLLERTATRPEAFGVFYRRHVAAVVGFLLARTRDRELAADLTDETFAAALAARAHFDPQRGAAHAWLYAIARNTLSDSARRGQVEDRARRALGIAPLAVDEDDLDRVEALADAGSAEGDAERYLGALEPVTRGAVHARVIEERDYADIAQEMRCSEAVVRKRVSRGLAALRARMEETG
jgi:RNA polymerase sigma factor (sigma-70 family)